MKTKRDLDAVIGVVLNQRRGEVSLITGTFLQELMNAIVQDGEVLLEGFGRFRLVESQGKRLSITRLKRGNFRKGESTGEHLIAVERKYTIHFKKAEPFREKLHRRFGKAQRIQEAPMEKFGVDESVDQETLEKKAADGCPECGRKPEKHGRVLMCPVHGTEPFEASK